MRFALFEVVEQLLTLKLLAAAKTEAGIVANQPIGALAHLGLARAWCNSLPRHGQGLQPSDEPIKAEQLRAKGRLAYQDFLNFWKDADPDSPILKQAKAEYTKLASREPHAILDGSHR